MSDTKDAIFRGGPVTTPEREAYDDFRDWALDELQPQMKRLLLSKLDQLAKHHDVPRRKIAHLLKNPPTGETRRDLAEFLYQTLVS